MALDDDLKAFATSGNFGALTTLFEDGTPQTNIMWVDADDEHVLINTEVHRAKYKNLERDPRATLVIWDKENPYRYIEVRGHVADTVRGQEARDHIDACSRRYTGKDYGNPIRSERVIVKIAPNRVRSWNV